MRTIAILALGLFAALPSVAVAGERLLVPSLPGWTVTASHVTAGGEVTEMVPPGQSAEGWTRRLTVQAFRGDGLSVPGFLEMLAANTVTICEPARAEPSRLGRLGPLEAGSRFVACGRSKAGGQGEYALAYGIRGRDAFYVVMREWRGAAFDTATVPVPQDELTDWLAFMRAVSVCDNRDPQRPCP